MSKYEELIERVKRLTGPDREVDRAIGRAIGKSETTFPQYEPDCVMPSYTDSLDAALTLVPEGWAWRLDSWLTSTARVFIPDSKYPGRWTGRNAAIALCIAALSARAEQEKK